MAQFLITTRPGEETTIWRIEAAPGAVTVLDPAEPTSDELTEIIGRAAELAFESAGSPADVAGLAVQIQQRLVGQAGQT